MKSTSVPRLGWHLDFHTPGNVRINHNPDPDGTAKALKAAGVEEVITFAKCHYGYAYYPTKVGTPHPGMKGDALGNMIAACRKAGVKVLAYLSFGIDGQAGQKHPEWQQLGKDRKVTPLGWEFIPVCPFSRYLDEMMLPQIKEVATLHRPDGLWFDTMGALAPCHCETCRTAFRKDTGKDIPTEKDDPLHATYGRWRHDRGVAMVERVAAFIHDVLPGGAVGFNQLGSLYYPEPMARGVTELSLDPPTYGPQSLQFGMNAAFGGTTGIDCEVMPTIFNQGWGDWSLATELRLEQVAVAIWARGARLIYGDRLHPEVRLTTVSQRAIKFIGSLRKKLGAEFPAADAKAAPDVLILHSTSVTCGDYFEDFARRPRERMGRISGAYQLCLDAGLNSTIVAECYLSGWLDRARAVVMPELTSISQETETSLRGFVEKGGRLVVVGPIPKVDGRPLDWLGVRTEAKPWQDHVYLPAWRGQDKSPVLVRGDFHPVKLEGAKSIFNAISPYDALPGVRYGWGIGPASDKPSEHPALTIRRVGNGEVWHLGTPIFTDYSQHANAQQIPWFRGLWQHINAPLRATIDHPNANVELVLWENDSTTWAILIQHSPEQVTSMNGTALTWMRSVGPLPHHEVVLHLNREGRTPRRITSAGKSLKGRRSKDRIAVNVVLDSVWSVIRVDWKNG